MNGLCTCGCGESTPLAARTDAKRGQVKGQPVQWVRGHNARAPRPERIRPIAERFWAKVQKGDGCWEWLGPRRRSYGFMWVEGKNLPAHRLAYEFMVGAIPDGLMLDHLCRNKGCVRPDHLEPVTNAENVRRGNAARRAERASA